MTRKLEVLASGHVETEGRSSTGGLEGMVARDNVNTYFLFNPASPYGLGDLAEIAKDARIGGGLHRKLMMRADPSLQFFVMAIAAGIRADKGRRRHHGPRRFRI